MKTKLQFSIILAVLFFLIYEKTNAQVPDWRWVKSIGGIKPDIGNSIAVDDSGNVYTTGFFLGTVDFDPGVGTFNLTAPAIDSYDIFISKLDKSGNFVWAKSMRGGGEDKGEAIAIDGSGNVYTSGEFQGTVDFDPGPGIFNITTAGNKDVFVSKLDSSGNFVWAKSMSGPGLQYSGHSMGIDASGNVYITGAFYGTVDFDPGIGTFNLTAASNSRDIFIWKLNSSGNLVWAKRIGGTDLDQGSALSLDAFGNVCTTGSFGGTVDFDPGAGVFNLTGSGLFISKLDSSGNFVWAKAIGAFASSIALDASANVYITGSFSGTVDFDPGVGTFILFSGGIFLSTDIFILKLDGSGNFVWAKAMGGTDYDEGHSIAVDNSGNVYTTGEFLETADFDPSAGTLALTSAESIDIFISKLDSSGNLIWAKALGGGNSDFGYSIAAGDSGNVYITGAFSSYSITFGTTTLLTHAGSNDIFIAKLNGVDKPCSAITCSINPTLILTKVSDAGCNNGEIKVKLGSTFQAFPHIELYDSSNTMVNLVNLTAGVYNYTFTNLAPGSYMVKVFDSNCCEQDLAANLKCLPPKTGLTATNITATGARLNWDVVGCPAGYRLKYRVQGTSVWTTIGVINVGFRDITGLQPLSTYEWLVGKKCTGHTTAGIWFSSKQTFTTAALRTGEALPDVSAMESFEINIKPNPALTNIDLNFESEYSMASLKIVNITGQVVFEKKVYSSEGSYDEQLDVSGFNNGIYVLLVETANGVSRKKFAKE